jgi:hypothetical protein
MCRVSGKGVEQIGLRDIIIDVSQAYLLYSFPISKYI